MLPNNAAARNCRGITVEADDLADSLSTGQSTQHPGCGGHVAWRMREREDGVESENWIGADDLGLPHGRIGRGLKNNLAGILES